MRLLFISTVNLQFDNEYLILIGLLVLIIFLLIILHMYREVFSCTFTQMYIAIDLSMIEPSFRLLDYSTGEGRFGHTSVQFGPNNLVQIKLKLMDTLATRNIPEYICMWTNGYRVSSISISSMWLCQCLQLDTGFVLNGPTTRQCLPSGVWSNSAPVCERK